MQNIISKIQANPLVSVLLGAIVLSLGWHIYPLFIFLGFIPLICLIENENLSNKKLFYYSYSMFLVWNVAATWWVVNSTWIGAILAFVLNSLLMCIPVILTRHILSIKPIINVLKSTKLVIFIFLWISFEYLHMQWDLTWPWLNLGNTFGKAHYLVQWYEFTGAIGGTAWALLINILIYRVLIKPVSKRYIILTTTFIFPILISLSIYFTYDNRGKAIEVVIVQPNIDPFTEKFYGTTNFIPYDKQLDRMIALSKKKMTAKTEFVFWPETSIPQGYDEDLMSTQPEIFRIKYFLALYPNATLVTGADTYKIYMKEFDKLTTSRYQEGVGWYDYFNTAVSIQNANKLEFYHKSKLVPGVECMPFPYLTKYLNTLAGDLGFIPGSLGTQDDRSVFKNKSRIGVAPIICYESIFGEFVSKYVKNGAQFLTIITNDGWWGDTPGHTQHLSFSRLRAIETRRSIARAANTGISCFVDQIGDFSEVTIYWQQDVRKENIYLNDKLTFYVRFGDYMGIICVRLSLLSVLIALTLKLFKKC